MNDFGTITPHAPIAARRITVSVNKNQFTNNVAGGTPIKRKLDFYDKEVNEFNEKIGR